MDIGHEFGHPTAAVVARDVGMKVEPGALDLVVVRAVRREELQHDASAKLREVALGALATVDDVVVEDDVDATGMAMLVRQAPDQLAEQVTGLPFAFSTLFRRIPCLDLGSRSVI